MKATLAILGLALFGLPENLAARMVKQWVSGVLGYSSQYGSDKYSAQQILGAPDVYPGYADDKRAWAPNYIDANQFLEFQFTTSVYVTQLDVYETFNGGGVKAIKCFDVSEKWITLWSTDKVSVKRYPRIFSPSFTSTISCFSNRIKLEIDCTSAGTWVEIDAVMLYGTKEEEQWVSGVIGYSSQYGSDNFSAEAILGVPDMYPTYGKAIAAWAPDVIDENQFLEFQFATPVYVTKVDVYEVYKAGGVKAIKCFDVSEAWITLWSTKHVSVFESARIFSPSFTSERPCFSNHIRLDIDCTVANTWVQIDAVRLHGSKEAVQWANAVIGYSSEYGSDKWSAKQTLGLPDVYPRYADDKKAWAPDVIDAHQYLLLQFATPVYVTQVDVYETFNAGGVKEIVCYDYQENAQRRIRLWSTDKVSAVKSARIFSPSLTNNIDIGDCFSNEILLIIDCTAANTWVEIDAVRLKGYQKPWSRLAKRDHVNEVLEDEEDKAVTAVESAAAKMSIKQLLAHVRK